VKVQDDARWRAEQEEERENGLEGQMGIIAEEVVDAQHSAHNGTAVGAGGNRR
jgi:hypothetical protein